jgi:hypothetical protein
MGSTTGTNTGKLASKDTFRTKLPLKLAAHEGSRLTDSKS